MLMGLSTVFPPRLIFSQLKATQPHGSSLLGTLRPFRTQRVFSSTGSSTDRSQQVLQISQWLKLTSPPSNLVDFRRIHSMPSTQLPYPLPLPILPCRVSCLAGMIATAR